MGERMTQEEFQKLVIEKLDQFNDKLQILERDLEQLEVIVDNLSWRFR
jgi:hypothetical protein